MINTEALEKKLCQTFCASISVNPVPRGYAVSTLFLDRSGDRVGCYVVEDGDGFRIEDDGEYLARLIGSGIPIDQGMRGQLLDSILAQSLASWDRDEFIIRGPSLQIDEIGSGLIQFISSLMRVRDLELLTRDVVRSTFREDAIAALEERFGKAAHFEENAAVDQQFREFPSDLIIRPRTENETKAGALYFVTSNEKLNEALLLFLEAQNKGRGDFQIIAMLEDADMRAVSRRHFQRAQNRSLSMPIFRGDEEEAVNRIGRDLAIAA